MKIIKPAIAYLASIIVSSLAYILCINAVMIYQSPISLFSLGFSLFFWLFGGMFLTYIVMIFPWFLVLRAARWFECSGVLYYLFMGGILALAIGCANSSLAPKPLFVEDQTFLEGCIIAAKRQGPCFFLAGMIFGLTHWFIIERQKKIR